MPSESKKQHNFMAAVAHNPKFAKQAGVPQSVGKDFVEADKGKKFSKGGSIKHDDVAEDKKLIKRAIKMHDQQEHKGEHTDLSKLKTGGKVKDDSKDKKSKIKEVIGPKTMSKDVEKSTAKEKKGPSKGFVLGKDTGPTASFTKGGKTKGKKK